jgi:NAD(P) transhydrogenase
MTDSGRDFDLIVIGSGPAGEKGAAQAAYFGRKVALVERATVLGGACVNTGTIPSKTLRETALHLSGFRQRELFGVDLAGTGELMLSDLMKRKREVMENEWALISDNLDRHHIERYLGAAELINPNEVKVWVGASSQEISGDVILIATGSSPLRPPSIPFDDCCIYDSDSILTIDRIPKDLAIIGAGVIGCEYASIFAALGTRVFLIDGRTSLLPHIDREIVDVLLGTMTTRLNVQLRLGSEVEQVITDGERATVTLRGGERLEVEKVLVASGRVSNTAGLGLERAGVVTGKRGIIPVDEHFRTNVPNIYAAGDVIGFPALASTSMEQARVAMVHAFDLKYKTSVSKTLPYGIYTIPELSTCGATEEECAEKGINFAVGRAYYRKNPRGQIIGDVHGMLKLVFDADTLKILGVHIVGENASELVHTGMMAMQFGGTIEAFIDSVFNYPTLGDAYKYAAYDGLGNVARARLFGSAE